MLETLMGRLFLKVIENGFLAFTNPGSIEDDFHPLSFPSNDGVYFSVFADAFTN